MRLEDTFSYSEDVRGVIQELETRVAELTALTEEQKAIIENLLEKLSRDQTLVDLYNSRGFRDKTERLIGGERNRRIPERASQLAVILLDVNEFKGINDIYGHAIGDVVLEALAEILITSRRDEDVVARLDEGQGVQEDEGVLAGRLGGDEFAIALPGADMEGAQQVLDRIKAAVSEAVVESKKGPVQFSVSGGIAVFKEGMSVADMLDLADEEMYKDKKSGRGSRE